MITKPKGTYDLIGNNAIIYNYVSNLLNEFMRTYNYEYIRTPIFEATELYHRTVGEETDIVSKETYDFQDKGERNITLRPEGTAGVVRSFIENKLYGNRNDAIKLYYNGTMYRYERPQKGRFREFSQLGVEVFNADNKYIDAEVISMGYFFLNTLGIEDVTVMINSLGDKESRDNYTKALVKYLEPHKEELCSDCKRRLETNPLRILDCKVDEESSILKNVPKISDYLSDESKNRFNEVKKLLGILDVDYEVDEKIVRGLDYYDEIVFEYKNKDGLALGAGGRYNHLVESLGGPNIPAIGFAFGFERLSLELENILDIDRIKGSIDAYILSVNEEENIYALKIAQDLRLNGLYVEVNNNNLSLKSQFKLADSLKAKFDIILKSEELNKNLVTIRDNATKEEAKVDLTEVVEWIEGNI